MADDGPTKLSLDKLEEFRRLMTTGTGIAMTRYAPCLCRKLLDVVTFERRWHSGRWRNGRQLSPGIIYSAVLCDDCQKEFKQWPRIVCLGCRSLMGFYKPGRQKTGFVFERERHYHIVDCPKCNPSRRSTPVIEHEKFCRENKIRTTTPHDLLQEIEIKILQGEREAAILRKAFNASSK